MLMCLENLGLIIFRETYSYFVIGFLYFFMDNSKKKNTLPSQTGTIGDRTKNLNSAMI